MGKGQNIKCFYSKHRRIGDRIVKTGPASLLVAAVNHSPGEVTILSLKGRYKDESVHNITLQNSVKKLGQGDRLARAIIPMDQLGGQFDGFYNKDGIELVDIWFEDTFGLKYLLKNVKITSEQCKKLCNYIREIRKTCFTNLFLLIAKNRTR